MNLLFSIFFGAGAAAFVYSKLGRRVGYGNSQNQVILAAVTFVLSSIIFFTILATLQSI